MKRAPFICILFSLFCTAGAFAQTKYKLGKTPRAATKDYRLLAHALTDSLPNDSLKIRSIFLWEAKHIRYGGGSNNPNQILQDRAAVCLGYSILFDSLCRVAGIQAEVVPGYVYMPWYEPVDTIYLARHAWNAVLLNGEWKLVDVTWSRGRLVERKQPFKRWLCKKFNVPFVPLYRYKKTITDRYYMTDPERMVLDHLPTTPAWQLLDCSVPMDSFQRSPHSVEHFLASPVFCKNGNDSIAKIVSEPEYMHLFIAGKQGLKFSPRDHYVTGYGAEVYAGYYQNMAGNNSLYWQTKLLYYDSTIRMVDTSLKYLILTMRDIRNERNYFLRRNRRMLARVNKETRPMYRLHMRQIPAVRHEQLRTFTLIRKLRRENHKLRRESRHIRHIKIKISRPETPQPGTERQRDRLSEMYEANNDSVAAHQERMDQVAYYNYSWEVDYQNTLVNEKKRLLSIMRFDMEAVLFFKSIGKTCFDTLVYSPKNQCLMEQHQFDSVQLLLRKPGKWRIDSTAKLYANEAVISKRLIRRNLSILQQMARLPQGTEDEKAEAGLQKAKFISINDSLIAYNKQRIKDLRHYRKSLANLRGLHRSLKRMFHSELRGEAIRYAGTARFFYGYYRDMSVGMQGNIRAVRQWKGTVRRGRRQLQMYIRRREREHAKAHRIEQKKLLKEGS